MGSLKTPEMSKDKEKYTTGTYGGALNLENSADDLGFMFVGFLEAPGLQGMALLVGEHVTSS